MVVGPTRTTDIPPTQGTAQSPATMSARVASSPFRIDDSTNNISLMQRMLDNVGHARTTVNEAKIACDGLLKGLADTMRKASEEHEAALAAVKNAQTDLLNSLAAIHAEFDKLRTSMEAIDI